MAVKWQSFKLEHLNKAPAVFDYKKLEYYNGNYIRLLSDEELYKWTLPFITGTGDAAEMVHFLFTEPAVPAKEQIVPKRLDEAKTKEVLEAAKEFVKALPSLDHEGSENLAKEYAEKLGIKLGDFMMPIRMAVTGSKVSPPLIGSILILGVEDSLKRIDRTLAAF